MFRFATRAAIELLGVTIDAEKADQILEGFGLRKAGRDG